MNKIYSCIGMAIALLIIFGSENSFAATLPTGSDPGVQLKKNQENELKQKMEEMNRIAFCGHQEWLVQ